MAVRPHAWENTKSRRSIGGGTTSGTFGFDLADSIGLSNTGTVSTVTIVAADVIAAGSANVTDASAGDFTVNPQTGSVEDDFWTGSFGAPATGDPTGFILQVADPTQNIITFTETLAGGGTNPPIGVKVLGVNSQGIFGEQVNDYFSGAPSSYVTENLNPNQFYVFSKDELSITDPSGFPGPTQAELTFGPTVCFVSGTRIACASGDVAVEELRIGDHVMLAGGGTLPIRWIGRRRIDCRTHPEPDSVLPIRIAPGAFGDLEPKRALYLSPEHAVFADGVLIPVRHLVNGSSIRQVARDAITYYHVELERHEVLLAEGLAAESFLDAACNRAWFDNGPRLAVQVPERASTTWECRAYAPLVVTGRQRDAIRRRLAARAAGLGLDISPLPVAMVATAIPAI